MKNTFIILINLCIFSIGNAQITDMIIHQTNGNITSYLITDIDSITYTTSNNPNCPTTFTDARDNELYTAISIGNQCWMAQNLRYDAPSTASLDTVNANSPSPIYGRLYDWYTIMNGETSSATNPSGVQGLCPAGWHIPSDGEWNELELALGMDSSGTTSTGIYRGTHGIIMKSLTGWNTGTGTNSSNFNAFPTGAYEFFPLDQGISSPFWSSTQQGPLGAWYRVLWHTEDGVSRNSWDKSFGFACRCVKN